MTQDDKKEIEQKFRDEVTSIVRSASVEQFNLAMKSEEYSAIKKEEKEYYFLETTLSYAKFYLNTQDFLRFLIIDYKIDEEIYKEMASPRRDEKIEAMFAKRKWAEQLESELKVNEDASIKKPKV